MRILVVVVARYVELGLMVKRAKPPIGLYTTVQRYHPLPKLDIDAPVPEITTPVSRLNTPRPPILTSPIAHVVAVPDFTKKDTATVKAVVAVSCLKVIAPAPVPARVSAVSVPSGAVLVFGVIVLLLPPQAASLNSSDRSSRFAGAYTIRPVLSTSVALLPRENVTRLSSEPESRFR
jgi:hypothetical protein